MASLFGRIRNLVVAEAHHSIDGAENPQVMAQQVLRDLSSDIHSARRALVTALAAERHLERTRARMAADAADWEARAERLLRGGDENLAREALGRAVSLQQGAAAQEQPLAAARRTSERLRRQVERMRAEWQHTRNRVTVIGANQAAAEALGAVTEAADAYTRAMDRSAELDRFERKAEKLDAEAEVAAELMDEQDALERNVARHDLDAAVEDALVSLRAKVASPAEPAGAEVTVEAKFTVSEN